MNIPPLEDWLDLVTCFLHEDMAEVKVTSEARS